MILSLLLFVNNDKPSGSTSPLRRYSFRDGGGKRVEGHGTGLINRVRAVGRSGTNQFYLPPLPHLLELALRAE